MTTDPTFRMTVQETLSIKGRGTVVLGQIESGTISVDDEIWILSKSSSKTIVVHGLEVNRKVVSQGQKGSEADFTWQK